MLPNDLLQFVRKEKNISMEFVNQAKVRGGGGKLCLFVWRWHTEIVRCPISSEAWG